MQKRPVIARKFLPSNLPVFPTVTLWLLMDRLQASDTVKAVVWTLWVIIILAALYAMLTEERCDPVMHKGEDP